MKMLTVDDGWIRVSEAAEGMDMTPQGTLRRLKRLNELAEGRLLRRDSEGSPWFVSVDVLLELSRAKNEQDEAIDKLTGRVSDIEVKLIALRNSHGAHRRKTNKRLDTHERALKALRKANREFDALFS